MTRYDSWPTEDTGNVVGARLANEIYRRFDGLLAPLSFDDQQRASMAELLATTSETLNVKSFGAAGDGVADDTAAIQAAVSDVVSAGGGIVFLPPGTYFVAGTVTVGSNVHFRAARGSVTLLGDLTLESTGGFPNQMFTNTDHVSGNSNISFQGLKFDFSRDGVNFASGSGLTTVNSLKFAKVTNLFFEDCEFFDFVTNKDTDLSGKGLVDFSMAAFDACTNVHFHKIESSQIREEAFHFYDCVNVSFEAWNADGTEAGTSGTSSHAAFWYCDGVTVRNAEITHASGSVINCYSRNVWYENIRVNDGETQDGRGFDFSNEIDVKSFDVHNINVLGCYLNVTNYGLQAVASSFDQVMEGITIRGNIFEVAEDTILVGVRVLAPKSCVIENNQIILGDASSSSFGRCVLVDLISDTDTEGFQSNVHIRGNYLRGLLGVSMVENIDTSIDGLYVCDNTFLSQDLGALTSYDGASMFFHVRNSGSAVDQWEIKNVYVRNNNTYNVGGGHVYCAFDSPTKVVLSNWVIEGNRFEGVAANAERPIRVGGIGTTGDLDVRVLNNVIINADACIFQALKYLKISGNEWRWDTAISDDRIDLHSLAGTFIYTGNKMEPVNASFEDISEASSGSYDFVEIRGNVSLDGSGDPAFSTGVGIQTLTGAGAVDVINPVTHIETTGVDALTLADGGEAQEKLVVMTVDNGAGTLTPSNLGNGTTITFDDVGDSASLVFTNGAWYFQGGTATLA